MEEGAGDHRLPAATAEQIVDIPVPRGAPHDLHQDPLRATGSSGLPGTANQGFFCTFPRDKKSATSAAVRSPSVPASVSSWTRAACEDLDSADEPATQQNNNEELLFEEEDYPSGWFVSKAASGPASGPPFSGIGARAGPCGTSLLGPPRGRGRGGKEDQDDSLLRSSSTPAVAYAVLVWPVAPRALFPVGACRPEMLCIMARMNQKDSIALLSGSCMCKVGLLVILHLALFFFPSSRGVQENWTIWEMTSRCFRMQRTAWTSLLHAMRQPTVLWLFSTSRETDSHLFGVR